jgi:tRNA(Ile)-lysidine synthase
MRDLSRRRGLLGCALDPVTQVPASAINRGPHRPDRVPIDEEFRRRLLECRCVLTDRVSSTIRRHQMLPPGARIIAAVSGGPDSVCLLEILLQLNLPVSGIAHLNHKLRGEESDADESFVEQLARQHALPFFVQAAAPFSRNLEQSARRARQQFFRQLLQEGKADRIALGHTRDDQAETVLLRLLRGSGLRGVAGILPVTKEGLIRPLFDVTRAQIEAFLHGNNIPYRQDRSNLDPRFTRNRVRHDLLPKLAAEYNPNIRSALAHFADTAREDEALLEHRIDRLAARLLTTTPYGIELDYAQVSKLHPSTRRRLFRRVTAMLRGDLRRIDYTHIERLVDLRGKATLPGIIATLSMGRYLFALEPPPPPDPIPVEVPGCYLWPSTPQIRFEVTQKESATPCVTLGVELCWNPVLGPLELRGWRAGDAYRPAGRQRVHSLKELFQNHRVPSWRRSAWPILSYRDTTGEQRIAWVREFGPAAELTPPADYTGPVLRIYS